MKLEQIGKYKILGKIGQGAMGDVYKAHDTVLNRKVAIKTIVGNLVSDDQFKKRFEREAQSAAQLNHRNIVTVFEFSEDKGVVYLVMELLEGTDLKDLISRKAIQGLDKKLQIVEQICDGLAYAHDKGVVHRDLKPANIHVLPNGVVKIMDFGLARLGVSEMTRTGTVMGTPNYMSPEQVRGEKVDNRSDIFSVGAVTYEVLAGHKPFEADTMHSVLYQVLDQQPQPLQNWTPDLPASILPIVDRALAKDPAQRFQTAADMRVALRHARRSASGRAAGPEPAATGASWTGDATRSRNDESSAPATYVSPRRDSVVGATALDLAPAASVAALATARPDPTAYATPPSATGRGRLYAIGGAGLLVAAAAVGGLLWMRPSGVPAPSLPPADLAKEQEGILREALVSGQIELAQGSLENKNYAEAIAQADRVLALDPGNAAAQDVSRRAHASLDQLETAAREARAAFARGDTAKAAQELARVLAIDPRHPVAGELSAALNNHFRAQAEEARTNAERARTAAARARSFEGFSAAEGFATDADGLFKKGQFAEATQKFAEAADGFARAKRGADAAEAAAQVTAQRAASTPSTAPSSFARPSAAPSQAASAPPTAVSPSALATATATTTSPAAAPPPSSAPSVAPAAGATAADAAISKVIYDYSRAVETRDINLFKTVKPDLSKEEEKRLQEAFKTIQSHRVGLIVESVKVEGGQATVHVLRADTVNGQPMKPQPQTFKLMQRAGIWVIQSIGQ